MTIQEAESKLWYRVIKKIWKEIILGGLFTFLAVLDLRTAIFMAIILAISVIFFIFYLKTLRRIMKKTKGDEFIKELNKSIFKKSAEEQIGDANNFKARTFSSPEIDKIMEEEKKGDNEPFVK
jgi:hypothetical protein